MATVDFAELLGPALGAAISAKGFTELTPVQKAVLDPALAGRDLRVTSQTGSGKTVAIGLVIRELAGQPSNAKDRLAHPRALVIVPTRELAKQVVQELTWLYAPLNAKVASVTGGAVYRDEHRALSAGPSVVVGTPGRMLDHLNRGSIDPSEVAAVVLDEADRMLDLGFREELEAILGKTPKERSTHLVSATFPREVEALANSVQRSPARVEATRLGVANVDIDHVMHVLEPRQRLDALINLLLANPEAQTLVFARTRADVSDVAERLSENGFAVTALSGEMDQRERDRALTSFRRADHRILVATDVAARGIDVQDITLVVHLDPPTDADSYTHRSGRTGRAGRKGRSVLLVSPSAVGKTTMLLKRVKVVARTEPVPSAEQIRASADQKFFDLLTREDEPGESASERQKALAERLAAREDSARVMSRLLAMARFSGPTEPREIRRSDRGPERKAPREREREQRGPAPRSSNRERPDSSHVSAGAPAPYRGAQRNGGDWVSFRITWGGEQGADARKLLAMACRWGEIRGSDVGAIEIERDYSRLSVKASVAATFAEATSKPDSRNPRVTIQPDDQGFAPRTMAPPPPRDAAKGREAPKTRAAEAEAESVPRQPERAAYKKHADRTREAAPRAAAPREGAHAARGSAPREGAHAPRPSGPRPSGPREGTHAPRPGAGFPREASRPRVATGYPRDAKKRPRDAARPQAGSRPASRAADAPPPRDGGEPPRRRRVVTR
ncbi:MAG TPA: DEAD/DEAH box helicase [Polyangiaceae bacterium]|nr:DEAD/DEAH box helicase [Polyangiaceae bacterium]